MERIIENLLEAHTRGKLSRRRLVGSLTALVGAAAAGSLGAAGSPTQESTFRAVGLNHIALRVTDVPRSRDFYIRHLGMGVMRDSASSAFLSFGEDFVALFRGREPAMDHYCYSVEGYTAGGAVEKLRAVGIEPRRSADRVYFPDPDGLIVQLAAQGFRA